MIYFVIIYNFFKEYTTKQLMSLVNCTLYNNKRTRQKLLSLIEEMERR